MTTLPSTDHDLLRDFTRDRSHAAFTLLVERHADMIYAAALRQTKNAALAEDITQAVFIILMQRAHTIRDARLLAAWLLQTTRYCAKDALKSERRRKMRETATAIPEVPHENSNAHEQITTLLDEGMAKLSPLDRQAIILRFWNEQPLAEVGTALGLTEETAKKRVQRALEKLRHFFTNNGIPLGAATVTTVLADSALAAAPVAVKASCTSLGITALSGGTSAAAIAKGALVAMKISKLTAIVACAFLLLVTGVSACLIHHTFVAPSAVDPAVTTPFSSLSQPAHSPNEWFISGVAPNGGAFALAPGESITVKDALLKAGVASDAKTGFDVRLIRLSREDFESVEDLAIGPALAGPDAAHQIFSGDALLVNPAGAGFHPFTMWDSKPFLATLPAQANGEHGFQIIDAPARGSECTVRLYSEGAPVVRLSLDQRPLTVLQALAAAGLNENLAWPNAIHILQTDGQNFKIDTRDLLTGTVPDHYLQPGDGVYLECDFNLLGFERSGGYAITSKHMTMKEALSFATPKGDQPNVPVFLVRGRDAAGNPITQELDIKPGWTGKDVTKEVHEWDILTVHSPTTTAN